MEIQFIFWLIILVMSVVIHEVSHGYVAQMFGDPTPRLQGRLTLNPIKHLDMFGSIIIPLITFMAGGIIFGWAKPVEINPYNMTNRRKGELFTALAGPASNLILALIFGLIIRFAYTAGLISEGFMQLSVMIVITNITLAIFNLIPIPPLDGSKIVFSLLPARYEHIRNYMEMYSLVLVILLILVLWRFITPIIPFIFTLLTGLQ
jgi:Zn-dependent protease